MTSSLPPLPEMKTQPSGAGASVLPGAANAPGSITPTAFSGGLPGMMQSMQQIEAGVRSLATELPSLAPMLAAFVSQLRLAVPDAMSAGAGIPLQGGSNSPLAAASAGLPLPPQ